MQEADFYPLLHEAMEAARLPAGTRDRSKHVSDFVLPNEQARLVTLQMLLRRGPVILLFFAGSWCSHCKVKLRDLILSTAGHDISVVALTPETAAYPRIMKKQVEGRFTLLSDVDYAVATSFGVQYKVPDAVVKIMKQSGIDLVAMHGVIQPKLFAPSVFVISKHGEIVFEEVKRDYTSTIGNEPVVAACVSRL